jgi:hypothetical protein
MSDTPEDATSVSISTIDLTRVAFSVRGNWMSVLVFAAPEPGDRNESRFHGLGAPEGPLGPGVYLRSNHARGVIKRELMRVRPVVDGRVLDVLPGAHEGSGASDAETAFARVSEDGDHVAISHDERTLVTICLGSDTRALIQTHGCGVELEAVPHHHASAYADGDTSWTINLRHATRRYRVAVTTGEGHLEQTFESTDTAVLATSITLTCSPSEPGGDTELVITEYWSAWTTPAHHGSSSIRVADETAHQRSLFNTFANIFPALKPSRESAARLARWILWSRTQAPSGRLQRETVFMDLATMDQIWSWDNLFNMAALAKAHPALAWDQLGIFADHQDENGAYPDGMNDVFYHYNFGKPPVHGVLLDWLDERVPAFIAKERVRPTYDTVSRFAEFWLNHRLDEETKLPFYIHGNETQDNSTFFDGGLPVITPDLPAYLARTLDWLAHVAPQIGEDSRVTFWRKTSDDLVTRLVSHLWNGSRFVALRLSDRQTVAADNVLRLAPLLVSNRLPAEIVKAVIADLPSFMTEHGIATESPSSPKYREDAYWRGPIWAPTTFLMVRALDGAGESTAARELAARFCHTCERAGFAENFGALTGEGFRDAGYTWTAAVYLWLAHWLDE